MLRLRRDYSLIFAKHFVRIAIQPALTGLGGRNHRMTRRACVFAGVPVRRAIAAKSDAALLARAKMDPACADFHALGAFANFWLLHGVNGVEMTTTTIGHNYFLLLFEARRR